MGLLLLAALPGAGCASQPVSPSFPLTEAKAERELAAMAADPRPLARPLIVIGGYADPGFAASEIWALLRPTVSDGLVVRVALGGCDDFAACRDRVIEGALAALPPPMEVAPGRFESVEVDIVANSMAGLVARDVADWPATDVGRHADVRLRAARIMTIATPHRGSLMADPSSGDALTRDLAPGSAYLQRLDAALPAAEYELRCYVRLGDRLVGTENCAPPGQVACWVADPLLEPAHVLALHDRRVLAEIARRLRRERPYVVGEPAPYPATPEARAEDACDAAP